VLKVLLPALKFSLVSKMIEEVLCVIEKDGEILLGKKKRGFWEGEVKEECGPMKPRWFNVNEIPYNEMWEDDKYWLPLVLNGQKIKAKFYFENDRLFLSIIDKWK